ncbi:beta-ketoacyl-ACP synthase III [Chryseobacterium sp.]|uniref:beta-ketoacyl-ACP synthase III n=1 Tax=Chryseobacterium sp. TaxID=1871047 RepID=UPI002899FFA0|nr:beta-ketoacyl-ACP synthase III [Chryseobacterium sp.]
MINAVIAGVGGFVPAEVRTNEFLSTISETSDEWIVKRTGIKERRILEDGLATSDMIVEAMNNLLDKTKISQQDIDCIIVATSTPDMPMPSTAAIVAQKLRITNAFLFDVNSACSGFMTAFSLGTSLIETRKYKNVIVAGADKMSSVTDIYDRSTNILFGDGAGIVLLQLSENIGVIDYMMNGNGEGSDDLKIEGGGSLHPISANVLSARTNFIRQNGRVVFKNAVEKMTSVCEDILAKNNLQSEDVSWFVTHQANLRIIEAVGKNLNISENQVLSNVENYGNTSAASIPLCLWDFEDRLKKGDKVLITAFGAGFSWGAAILEWNYN